jgi:hypothetical protein
MDIFMSVVPESLCALISRINNTVVSFLHKKSAFWLVPLSRAGREKNERLECFHDFMKGLKKGYLRKEIRFLKTFSRYLNFL